jgi:hypothetical protein
VRGATFDGAVGGFFATAFAQAVTLYGRSNAGSSWQRRE